MGESDDINSTWIEKSSWPVDALCGERFHDFYPSLATFLLHIRVKRSRLDLLCNPFSSHSSIRFHSSQCQWPATQQSKQDSLHHCHGTQINCAGNIFHFWVEITLLVCLFFIHFYHPSTDAIRNEIFIFSAIFLFKLRKLPSSLLILTPPPAPRRMIHGINK